MKKMIGIKKYHHFRFSSAKPGVVYKKLQCDTAESREELLKDAWLPHHSCLPSIIAPKGLSTERQWYLFEEIRPFCPLVDQDLTCQSRLSLRVLAELAHPQFWMMKKSLSLHNELSVGQQKLLILLLFLQQRNLESEAHAKREVTTAELVVAASSEVFVTMNFLPIYLNYFCIMLILIYMPVVSPGSTNFFLSVIGCMPYSNLNIFFYHTCFVSQDSPLCINFFLILSVCHAIYHASFVHVDNIELTSIFHWHYAIPCLLLCHSLTTCIALL